MSANFYSRALEELVLRKETPMEYTREAQMTGHTVSYEVYAAYSQSVLLRTFCHLVLATVLTLRNVPSSQHVIHFQLLSVCPSYYSSSSQCSSSFHVISPVAEYASFDSPQNAGNNSCKA